jgi:pyruvate formate lyase activating enzyme
MEASLYEKKGDRIRCTACERYCYLREGQSGFCGVRTFKNGVLNLDVYNYPFGYNVDPIEKKPVLHMYPGSRILSFGTSGCNFACKYCQNYEMSQRKTVEGEYMTPEKIIKIARKLHADGIAYTYNEPTIFMEFAHDVGILAHKQGLFNIFVTNGYETPESMEMAAEFLDAMTVDFKGNAEEKFYNRYISVMHPDLIYKTIESALNHGIHTEITDLVIPEIGDNLDAAEKMIAKIKEIGGEYMPVSFLRYHPDYKLSLPYTPLETLKEHYNLAKSMGMHYIYLGNVREENYENTYCPGCGALLIQRHGFDSTIINLNSDGRCTHCGFQTGILLKTDIIQ